MVDTENFMVFNEDMAKIRPLTIPNIISAMKQAGFTTKADLETLRKQIDDDQFEARTEFHVKMTLPAIEKVEKSLKVEIAKVDNKVGKLSLEVAGIKDDVKGLSGEFATTPSRKEFEEFKRAIIAS